MALLKVDKMHILVDQALQEISLFVNKSVEPEEVDLQLNRAMYDVIEAILDETKRARLVSYGFEANQLSVDALRTIKVKNKEIKGEDIKEVNDAYVVTLPDNYLHSLEGKASFTLPCYDATKEETVTKTVSSKVRVYSSNEIDKDHPFMKPTKESVIAEVVGNELHIIPFAKAISIEAAYLSYLKKPDVIKFAKDGNGEYDDTKSVHCELGDSTHYLVVDLAVAYLAKALGLPQNKINNFEQEKLI